MAMFALLAGTATVAAGEWLPGNQMSAYCLAHSMAATAGGLYYPVGGPGALEDAMMRSIRLSGGVVCRGAKVRDVVLEEVNSPIEGAPRVKHVRATGVQVSLSPDTGAAGVDDGSRLIVLTASQSVVSGLGLLCTYTKLLPAEVLSEDTIRELRTLQETRPVARVVYWLKGSVEQLGLERAAVDHLEVGGGHAAGGDGESNPSPLYMRVWSPSRKDPSWHSQRCVLCCTFTRRLTRLFMCQRCPPRPARRCGGGGCRRRRGALILLPATRWQIRNRSHFDRPHNVLQHPPERCGDRPRSRGLRRRVQRQSQHVDGGRGEPSPPD